jgi:hypothetical protein
MEQREESDDEAASGGKSSGFDFDDEFIPFCLTEEKKTLLAQTSLKVQ